MDEARIDELTKKKVPIYNLIGTILQAGTLAINNDKTQNLSIQILKGELILIHTDPTEEDPFDRTSTFSNLHALTSLYDFAKEKNFCIPLDVHSLPIPVQETLAKIKKLIDTILPERKIDTSEYNR